MLHSAAHVAERFALLRPCIDPVLVCAEQVGADVPTRGFACLLYYRACMVLDPEDVHDPLFPRVCVRLAYKSTEMGRIDMDRFFAACKLQPTRADLRRMNLLECDILGMHGFIMAVDLPLAPLEQLSRAVPEREPVQMAFALLEDSFRTPLCLVYTPQVIAAAILALAQDSESADTAVQAATNHLRQFVSLGVNNETPTL